MYDNSKSMARVNKCNGGFPVNVGKHPFLIVNSKQLIVNMSKTKLTLCRKKLESQVL